jgi:hypothetical protein
MRSYFRGKYWLLYKMYSSIDNVFTIKMYKDNILINETKLSERIIRTMYIDPILILDKTFDVISIHDSDQKIWELKLVGDNVLVY